MSDSCGNSSNTDRVDAQPSTSTGRVRKHRTQASGGSRTNSANWSEDEKMQLAEALQRYGHRDLENLHKLVPTKSCEQIKSYIRKVIKEARRWDGDDDPSKKVPQNGSIHTKAPIDQWLLAFEEAQKSNTDEFGDCLAKTFLYISRYEPHADPKDCDGVDYAAMYEFLYLALSGYPVKALSPETASAVLDSLDAMSERIRQDDSAPMTELLTKVKTLVYAENATTGQNGSKNDEADEGPMKSLMDVKGFNPLNIPYELLKIKPRK